ncbi:MAG: phage antirepressor KilAC domain-containing protein [Alkaliphilus sp.]
MNELMKKEIKMTSLDLARLTNKQHHNVMRDIKDEIEKIGEIGLIIFDESSYTNKQNKEQPCYTFGRKGAMQIALRYDAKIRYRVIEKIEELENKNGIPQLPANFIEALERLIVSEKSKIALETKIELMKPKVELYEVLLSGENNQTIGEVAKSFGLGRNKLFETLRDAKILITTGAMKNTPYQRYLDSEHFDVREVSTVRGDKRINVVQTMVTPKGIDYIGKMLKKESALRVVM